MKKRICIVTINDLENYGNRFQNIAIQLFLENNFNAKVRTLWPNNLLDNERIFRNYIANIYHSFVFSFPIKSRASYYSCYIFQKFNKIVKKERCLYLPFGYSRFLNKHYDYFVAGSDQVWSCKHSTNLRMSLLGFADKNKRISYAASIGGGVASAEEISNMKAYLPFYKAISVREPELGGLLKDEMGLKSSFNIDPVFLLSQKEWLSIGKTTKSVNKIGNLPFILFYWLGKANPLVEKFLSEQSASLSCKIIKICLYSKNVEESYFSPSDFVWLVHHAKAVLTNSFHGTALSIIFHKTFVSIPIVSNLNDKKDTRVNTLKTVFGLPDSCFTLEPFRDLVNWENVDKQIEMEKDRSLSFFKEAFSSNEKEK